MKIYMAERLATPTIKIGYFYGKIGYFHAAPMIIVCVYDEMWRLADFRRVDNLCNLKSKIRIAVSLLFCLICS